MIEATKEDEGLLRQILSSFSCNKDEDIENAKKSIISGIRSIDDEQDTEITYFFGQEITNEKISTEEYIKNINQVSKESYMVTYQLR